MLHRISWTERFDHDLKQVSFLRWMAQRSNSGCSRQSHRTRQASWLVGPCSAGPASKSGSREGDKSSSLQQRLSGYWARRLPATAGLDGPPNSQRQTRSDPQTSGPDSAATGHVTGLLGELRETVSQIQPHGHNLQQTLRTTNKRRAQSKVTHLAKLAVGQ